MPRPITFIVGLLLLGACSTEGKVTPLTSSAAPVPVASLWSLSVQGCPEASQCEDLRTSLAGHLVGAGLAARIAPPGEPADMSLDVQVSRVRSVSGTERVLFGVLAGRNEVDATETLHDRRGDVLHSFKVESASASHPISGEASLSDAYRQFATDTVSALR